MSTKAKMYFDVWVERDLAPRISAAPVCPAPSSMMVELRASASARGITDDDLRSGVGDRHEAVTEAILEVLDSVSITDGWEPDARPSPVATPASAMQIAVSYLDGLRDIVGDDVATAADLVLLCLGRQGIRLTALDRSASLLPTFSRNFGDLASINS